MHHYHVYIKVDDLIVLFRDKMRDKYPGVYVFGIGSTVEGYLHIVGDGFIHRNPVQTDLCRVERGS